MRTIELDAKHSVTVDDADYELVKDIPWRWLKANMAEAELPGYAVHHVYKDNRTYATLLHRLIVCAQAGRVVTFKDGNGLNCQRSNLIVGTRAEGNTLGRLHKNSKTGVRNVEVDKKGGFRARVRHKGIIHKKWFSTINSASDWAEAKRKELHGEAAWAGRIKANGITP